MEVKNDLPLVSVVVPVKNEQDNICACLESLTSQTYPGDRTEILLVDGMSGDGTRDIVESFRQNRVVAGKIPVIEILDNPKGQRASGMNIGIRNAKGTIIVRIDARTKINSDYIEKCVETLLETNADNVGGIQKPIIDTDADKQISAGRAKMQQSIGLALSHPFGVGDAKFRLGRESGLVDTVYLGCFRHQIFERVGLFDEDAVVISEDADLNYRIRKAGGKVYLNKDIVAYYRPRDSIRELAKLYFRYGGAKAGNLIKTRRLTALRQLAAPCFVLILVFLALLSFITTYATYLLGFVLMIYFLADLWSSISISIENKQLYLFPRLIAVFPVLHFSWGFGFFTRLLQRPKPGKYWGY